MSDPASQADPYTDTRHEGVSSRVGSSLSFIMLHYDDVFFMFVFIHTFAKTNRHLKILYTFFLFHVDLSSH